MGISLSYHQMYNPLCIQLALLLTCHMGRLSLLMWKTSPLTSALGTSHWLKDFIPSVTPISPASPVSPLLCYSDQCMHMLYHLPSLRDLVNSRSSSCYCLFLFLSQRNFSRHRLHIAFSTSPPINSSTNSSLVLYQSTQRAFVKVTTDFMLSNPTDRYFSFLILLVLSVTCDTIN